MPISARKSFSILNAVKPDCIPDAVVLVATTKALKMHGGVPKSELNQENANAVIKGCANLGRHIRNIGQFGVPVIVAINNYVTDSEAEHLAIKNYCNEFDVECIVSSHWEHGGDGAAELSEQVIDLRRASQISVPAAV